MKYQRALVWFRRDLRDYDHAALYHALKDTAQVYCVFVFDTEILDALTNKTDKRVSFIWHSVNELNAALQAEGGGLTVLHGIARHEIPKLAAQLQVNAVYANHDYEPQAQDRDTTVAQSLSAIGIAFHSYKDQVIFEMDEVLTKEKPTCIMPSYDPH